DKQNCAADYRPDQVDTWCCASWCYVDKECPSAIQSMNPGMEGILFWSDNVCADDPVAMAQCPYKPQPNVSASDTSCACLNSTMPTYDLTKAGLNSNYADYGKVCAPHDATICEITYPNAATGMWCCMSWCWVAESCPTARASMLWPGRFYSDSSCQMDADVVSGCKYDLDACKCRGTLPSGTLPSGFASNYGESCSAWDSQDCKATWSTNPSSNWFTQSNQEWCCDAWCYVDSACPIAKISWLGTGYYFSYETCDDPSTTYVESTDTCTPNRRRALRRLGSLMRQALEDIEGDTEDESAQQRLLSARRRGGYSATTDRRRRRSPPAPDTRSPESPSTCTTYRCINSPPQHSHQRADKCYAASAAKSSHYHHNRDAAKAHAGYHHHDRDQTKAYRGYHYHGSDPSKAQRYYQHHHGGICSASSARRRSVPYGYTSKNDVMNNHGGNMPHQTNYGYSGSNAVSANEQTNVAMYAAGAAAAAAVVGAGAAYAYNSMYGDSYSDHRRRRAQSFDKPDLCTVTASGARN
ncbi:unnamed protein product, partial [Symbiodinium pilosum]